MLLPLALAACSGPDVDCESPLGNADRNCDGRADDDWDGDGSPADVDCDDHDPERTVDDADGDLSSTCQGDCAPDDPTRGARGISIEICDNVDNDCNDVIDVDDAGRSACGWHQEELRTEPVKLDLLFVVDTSGSMGEERGRLPAAGRDSTFFDYLAGTDTHLGVVSNNLLYQGHLHGPVGGDRFLDLTTADREQAVAWWLEAADFEAQGGFENTGLDAAVLALDTEEGVGGTFNLGFRREDAPLAIVFVTDSDDDSTVAPVDAWVPWLDGLEFISGLGTTRAHGLLATTLDDPYCPISELSDDYAEAVDATGGTVYPVCDTDWGPTLAAIAVAEQPRSVVRIALERIPIPATIRVTAHLRGGSADELGSAAVVYEPPDPEVAHVVVPQYLWDDLERVEVDYEVLPVNFEG